MTASSFLAADSLAGRGISWVALATSFFIFLWSVRDAVQRRQWWAFFQSVILCGTFLEFAITRFLQMQGIGFESVPPAGASPAAALLMSIRDWIPLLVLVCAPFVLFGYWMQGRCNTSSGVSLRSNSG